MSNDLLFSVLPRHGKTEMKSSSGVTRVARDQGAQRVDDKPHSNQQQQQADQDEMQKRHGKIVESESESQDEKRPDADSGNHLDTYA